MKTFEIERSSKTYTCAELTSRQLVEMCENILKSKRLTDRQRNSIKKNIKAYADNPNNENIKNKIVNVILQYLSRRMLLNSYDMLTYSKNEETRICKIVKVRKNTLDCYYGSSINEIS